MDMKHRTGNGAQDQDLSKKSVMIFGSGACAQKIAANLALMGINTWMATSNHLSPEPDSHHLIQWMWDTRLIHCSGFAGRFSLQLDQDQKILNKTVSAIVLAEDDNPVPSYAPYGLTPGSRIVTISDLEKRWSMSAKDGLFGSKATTVCFLCGWENEAHPAVAYRMLESCLHLQQQAANTYFMTGNMKVAATGSEELVQKAKRSGTVFFKFNNNFPTLTQEGDNGFTISFPDELTHERLLLNADWIVVDEAIEPSGYLQELICKFEIDRDDIGFAQSDNVRRWNHATNRRGIFVAGGSRGMLSAPEKTSDADQVTVNVLSFLEGSDSETLPDVSIRNGRCARCLTCHRLCPHKSIDIGPRITIVPEACQSCGICAAGCPGKAIEMVGHHLGPEASNRFRPLPSTIPSQAPRIVVFGCSRSAGRANALIRLSGHTLPAGTQMIEVPCAGTVAGSDLLNAFEAGAEGVMLCTCHTGNCQSEVGNQVARKRAGSTRKLLQAGGMQAEKLRVTSVAANMGLEFAYQMNAFAEDIKQLNTPSKENQNG